MSRFRQLIHEVHRRSLWQVLGIYVVGGWVALQIVDTLAGALKLPDWASPVALLLLIIGLPVVLATAFVQEGVGRPQPDPEPAGEPAATAGGSPIEPDEASEAAGAGTAGQRIFTWRNVLLGGMATFAVWGVVAAGWLAFRGMSSDETPAPLETADSMAEDSVTVTRIAVLPFSVRGGEQFAYLGEGMVDLLSTKLDGAGGWRRVDPRAVLAYTGSTGEALDPASARGIAERFRARFYVLGNVVEVGGRLRLDASLYDAEEGTGSVAEATVEGTAEETFDLLDDLASQLLIGKSELPGLGVASIAAVTTNSLDALKAYLEGEREFRAGRHEPAVDAFQRATRLDSTFALAWYRLGVAADWLVLSEIITTSADEAYRHAEKLSDHDRRLFEALQAVRRAEVEEAERLYRGILRSYPDDVEAWFQLGELLFHFGPFVGRSIAESRDAFQTVLYYEPDDVHAYPHLARIAAAEGDVVELDRLASLFRALQPEADRIIEVRTLRALATGDEAEQMELLEELRGHGDGALMTVNYVVPVFSGNLRGAVEVTRILTEPSRPTDVQAHGYASRAALQTALGQWTAASAVLDSAAASELDPSVILVQRAYLTALPFLARPRPELEAMRAAVAEWTAAEKLPGTGSTTWVEANYPAYPHIRLYLLGLLSTELGEPETALRYADDLEATPGRPAVESLADDLANSIRARVTYKREGAEAALAVLDRAARKTWYQFMTASPFFSQANERYFRAELLRELGRDEEAITWYNSFGQSAVSDLAYEALSQLRRAEIHEARGEPRDAIRHYRRFLELWDDVDPELQPQVREARSRMDALVRGRG